MARLGSIALTWVALFWLWLLFQAELSRTLIVAAAGCATVGTAVAVQRTIIAIAENHQREGGGVEVPEVLHAFGAPATIDRGA